MSNLTNDRKNFDIEAFKRVYTEEKDITKELKIGSFFVSGKTERKFKILEVYSEDNYIVNVKLLDNYPHLERTYQSQASNGEIINRKLKPLYRYKTEDHVKFKPGNWQGERFTRDDGSEFILVERGDGYVHLEGVNVFLETTSFKNLKGFYISVRTERFYHESAFK